MAITSSSHLAPDEVARHTFAIGAARASIPTRCVPTSSPSPMGCGPMAEREHELLAGARRRRAPGGQPGPRRGDPDRGPRAGDGPGAPQRPRGGRTRWWPRRRPRPSGCWPRRSEEIASRPRPEADVPARRAGRPQAEAAAAELRERTDQQVSASALEKARNEAEELIAQAREECRAMVEEAQGLRARVLADLSRRRKVLHAQIEQLRAGRERLAETVQDVRRSVDTIADDLFAAEDEARLAAEAAGRQAAGRPDEGTPEELAALLLAEEAEAADAEPAPSPVGGRGTVAVEETGRAAVVADRRSRTAPEPVTGEVAGRGRRGGRDRRDRRDRPEIDADQVDTGRSGRVGAEADGGRPIRQVRRLASRGARSAAADGTAAGGRRRLIRRRRGRPEPPEERHPLAVRRDELIAPDRDRPGPPAEAHAPGQPERPARQARGPAAPPGRSSCCPTRPSTSTARHRGAARPGAGGRGRRLVRRSGGGQGPRADVLVGIAHELAEAVVGPAPPAAARTTSGLADAEEAVVAEHVGSAFREWKGERVERLAGDHVVAAFSAGSIAVAAESPDPELEWVAVAGSGDAAVPRLRGQRPQRAAATGRGVPHRAPAPAGPPRVSMPARPARHLGCSRALPQRHPSDRRARASRVAAGGSSPSSIVLVILLRLPADVRRLLHRRPVVLLGQAPLGVAQALRDQGRADGDLRGHLRRDAAGQPDGGRAPAPRRAPRSTPRTSSSSGTRRSIGPYARWLRVGGRGRAVADRRIPGHRPVAELDPVPQQHALRRHRPAVPPQRRLLRVDPALRAVPGPLGPGGPDRGPAGHAAQPLPQRRHPDAGLAPAGAPGGEGPHLGHPRTAGPGQGGRLLPGPVQPRPLVQRVRAGCRLHRRARPAPGPRAAHPGVVGRRRPAHLQHPSPGVGAADPRGRAVVPGGPDRRAPSTRPPSRRSRSTRRRTRSSGPTSSATSTPPGRPWASTNVTDACLPGVVESHRLRAVGQQRHPGQRPAVGPDPDPADLRQAPGHPHPVPVQHPGHRPVQGQRRRRPRSSWASGRSTTATSRPPRG